jgi:hypothetical protein
MPAVEDESYECARGQGRKEAESEFSGGATEQRDAEPLRFVIHGDAGDGKGEAGFDEPDGDPGERGGLAGGDGGGG